MTMHLPQAEGAAAPETAPFTPTSTTATASPEALLPSPEAVRASLLAQAKATPDQVETIVAFVERAKARGATNYAQGAALIGCNSSTLSKLARGVYASALDRMCETLARYLRGEELRLARERRPVVETSVFRQVRALAELTMRAGTLSFLYGPSHAGKTTALQWCAEHFEDALYVRMPGAGGQKEFLKAVLRAGGKNPRESYGDLCDCVLPLLARSRLLIVDQFHEVFIESRVKLATISKIMEWLDTLGLGVLLCGTDAIPRAFEDDRFKRFLGQLENRAPNWVRIDQKPTNDDLRLIREGYGLPELPKGSEAQVEFRRVAHEKSLGLLCKYLDQAVILAEARGQALSGEHFLITLRTNEGGRRGIVKAGGAN